MKASFIGVGLKKKEFLYWFLVFTLISLIIILLICSGLIVKAIFTNVSENKTRYTKIMKNISDPINCSLFRQKYFDKNLTYVELLDWVDNIMEWVSTDVEFKRFEDPFKILENGTGRSRCGEYSIVYAAACFANGYECRLVSAFIKGDHAWVELKSEGEWVHVDPSPPSRINEPSACANKFYLFVWGYQNNGVAEYLAFKYNPYLGPMFFLIVLGISVSVLRWYQKRCS